MANKKKAPIVALDISRSPDLMRLAEQVEKTGRAQILKHGNKQIAKVTPIKKRPIKALDTVGSNLDAFRSAAGGWKEIVDVDKFLKDIYKSRDISVHPPVKL